MNYILNFYKELGIKLLNENKLNKWSFRYSNRFKTTLGLCNYTTREIIINETFASNATFDDVQDIILHEIAHALVGYEHQHNVVWKNKFIQLGGTGKILYSFNSSYVPFKYTATCCNSSFGRYIKPKTNIYCSNCSTKLVFNKSK